VHIIGTLKRSGVIGSLGEKAESLLHVILLVKADWVSICDGNLTYLGDKFKFSNVLWKVGWVNCST